MRYAITGGSGFIGRYFTERLAAMGHDVVILDLVAPHPDSPHTRYVEGDVRDPAACRDALEGAQRVMHLAAAHHDFGIERDTYFDVNERGTKTVVDVMDELGITELAFYSTVAVYGASPEPHTEETPPAPNTPYGESKLAGEGVLKAWAGQGPIEGKTRRCLVVRPTVTFGPRNFANMYTLIDQIHRGRFLLVGQGKNIKSLSYVENIVDCSLFLLDQPDRPGFDLVNYIDKPDLTSFEITKTVYDALGKKLPSVKFPMWLVRLGAVPFDIVIALTGKNLPISSARLKKLFSAQTKFEADRVIESGYQPACDLREGITRMVKWYLAEGKDQDATWHLPPAEAKLREPAGV